MIRYEYTSRGRNLEISMLPSLNETPMFRDTWNNWTHCSELNWNNHLRYWPLLAPEEGTKIKYPPSFERGFVRCLMEAGASLVRV